MADSTQNTAASAPQAPAPAEAVQAPPAQDPLNPPLSALVLAQRDMQGRILGDLRFMLHHFVQLQSARELGEEPAPAAPPVNRERLASFIGHLEQQIEKCLRPASKQSELDELEKHVTTTLLPVKAKLEQQLGNAAVANQAREAKRLQEQRATEKLALGRTPSPEHKVENIDATVRDAAQKLHLNLAWSRRWRRRHATSPRRRRRGRVRVYASRCSFVTASFQLRRGPRKPRKLQNRPRSRRHASLEDARRRRAAPKDRCLDEACRAICPHQIY